MNILVVVTHLLGTGHLRRSINLSQAFVASGHRVTLVSGGLPVRPFETDGVRVVQLPPLCSDGTNFTRLLTADRSVADEAYLASRLNQLCELADSLQPDIVITELFPFGRRVLRREFTALLELTQAMAAAPVVLSSVRDILAAPSSTEKAQRTEALVCQYYDGVVVHSDRATTALEVSWPVSERLQAKLFYTGYVAQSVDLAQATSHSFEVIVSAGGGSVGRFIYEAAIEAARLLPDSRWRLLIGGSDPQAEVAHLQALAAGTSVVIEPNRTDFRQLLQGAACSVSMCGYNTAIDLLLTGTPGVLIPFDAGGEQEQTLRAASLAERAAFSLVKAKDLNPEKLLQAIAQVCSAGRFAVDRQQFNGALETVRFATRLAEQR